MTAIRDAFAKWHVLKHIARPKSEDDWAKMRALLATLGATEKGSGLAWEEKRELCKREMRAALKLLSLERFPAGTPIATGTGPGVVTSHATTGDLMVRVGNRTRRISPEGEGAFRQMMTELGISWDTPS